MQKFVLKGFKMVCKKSCSIQITFNLTALKPLMHKFSKWPDTL